MPDSISDVARRLADHAEAVCRHYLSNGRREGRYWRVGDIHNTPGHSLYVRLHGPPTGKGAVGRWTDAASLEHGDLLDLIRLNRGFDDLRATLDEARAFLRLPQPQPLPHPGQSPVSGGSPEAARRLWAQTRPLSGTLAEVYLRARGIENAADLPALRFHPACWYRSEDAPSHQVWPALIAAVTDEDGTLTGIHRTWLRRDGSGKAPLDTPRRALGHLLGHGVRFGLAQDVLAAGEGIETVLALRMALPALPVIAATSASHLAALSLSPGLGCLYIARDNDAAGQAAVCRLTGRAAAAGVRVHVLIPATNDFNTDLARLGIGALRARLAHQLSQADICRFAAASTTGGG